ncbi:restriction endonuclease subunit S [Microbacterium sp. F51-2R]|uniref:restriction endonuclease subunit S n=1 Tax=Microbacterium sp. F51-2R TaxID=3445777 RepID=UPI003FA16127
MSDLEALNFRPMLIDDVFESMKASSAWYDKSKLNRVGPTTYPFVSRTKAGNGVDGFCARQEKDPEPGRAITIGLDTQTIGYQPVPFYTSQNIQILRHPRLNENVGLTLAALIKKQLGKFSWGGNGATLGRLKRTRIMVPVVAGADGDELVDWDGLDLLGSALTADVVADSRRPLRLNSEAGGALPALVFAPWDVVHTQHQDGLFKAHKGKRLIAAHRKPGSVPFVGAAKTNNSIVDFADTEGRFPGGWLTLVYNGDGGTGHSKYQPMSFDASDDVIALEPVDARATEEALLLIACLLTQQCVSKFNFGYKLTLHRLKRQKLMLPVTTSASGETVVDWDGMTKYGRVLRARAEQALTPVLESVK